MLRLTTMEKQVVALKQRTTTLESEVLGGNRGAAAPGVGGGEVGGEDEAAEEAMLSAGRAAPSSPSGREVLGEEGPYDQEQQAAPYQEQQAAPYQEQEDQALVSTDEEVAHDGRMEKRKARASRRLMSLLSDETAAKSGQPGTVRARTANLEADVAALKSRLSTLENQVSGNAFSGLRAALLQAEAQHANPSLKSRIVTLEEGVDSCRTRISTLEHTIMG
jgi:hypothetical protein